MSLAVLQASVLQTNGALSVAAGAQITVRTPAGALATLYEDRAGTTPTGANPIFADSKGFFRVYVAPGRYDVTVTTSSGTQVYEDIALFADGSVIGTAAAADLTTSATDTTAGRVLKVGDGGLLGLAPTRESDDLNNVPLAGRFYAARGTAANSALGQNIAGIRLAWDNSLAGADIGVSVDNNDRIFFRARAADAWRSWKELYHTGNLTIGHATGNVIPAGGANGALTLGTDNATPVTIKTSGVARVSVDSEGVTTFALPDISSTAVLIRGAGAGVPGQSAYRHGFKLIGGNQNFEIFADANAVGSASMRFSLGGSERVRITSTGILRPGADNTQSFGEASFRWSEIFAGNGTINTSDAREKTPVRPFSADEINAAKQLSREIGVYQWLESVENKGDSARKHVGMTVQRAIEIMRANNLRPLAYGFICYDEWDAVVERVADDNGDIVEAVAEQATEEVTIYSEKFSVVDGVAVRTIEPETVSRPMFNEFPVVDEEGNPVLDGEGNQLVHSEPVMVEVEKRYREVTTTEADNRYGFRYSQLNQFIARGLEARLAELEGV